MNSRNFSILLSLMVLALVASVSAAIITPANSATISGTTALLNASNSSLTNMTNCTYYALSVSTANSSWSQIGFQANTSQNPNAINATFDSNVLEDSNDYQFNATCRNLSTADSTVNTLIIVNNTSPGKPSITAPTELQIISNTSGITFVATVTDATTTSCTVLLALPSNNGVFTSYTGTYSTTSCLLTLGNFNASNDQGIYKVKVRASDGTEITDSSIRSFQLSNAGIASVTNSQGNAGSQPGTTSPSVSGFFHSNALILTIITLLVALTAFVIFFLN